GHHVAARRWRPLRRSEAREGLEQQNLRSASAGEPREEFHHRAHARATRGDEWNKEIGEAEMTAMQALLGDGKVGAEFLPNGRAFWVAGVDRLGAAIGFDAGKK